MYSVKLRLHSCKFPFTYNFVGFYATVSDLVELRYNFVGSRWSKIDQWTVFDQFGDKHIRNNELRAGFGKKWTILSQFGED